MVRQEQAALLPMQRQAFNKRASLCLAPRVGYMGRNLWFSELGLAALDVERTSLNTVGAVLLPAPHVDVDPTFIFSRWAAEVNTSRRSDHDAKFRVT